jgi:hypothetical protein
MRQFLVNGHEEEYPCCPCIRVMLRDTRTGRTAVVFEEDNYVSHEVDEEDGGDRLKVSLLDEGHQDSLLGRQVEPVWVYFNVIRVVNVAEDVSERDMLYRIDPTVCTFDFLVGESVRTGKFAVALQAAMAVGPM